MQVALLGPPRGCWIKQARLTAFVLGQAGNCSTAQRFKVQRMKGTGGVRRGPRVGAAAAASICKRVARSKLGETGNNGSTDNVLRWGSFFRDATVANRIATREAEEKGESTQFESWSSKVSEEPQARREEAHKGSSRVEVKKGEFAESPKRQRKLADKSKMAVNRKKAGRLQLSGSFLTEVSRGEPSDADGEENRSLPVPV
ncbi:hypothetical protein MRS44_012213 [Fusarium solani]|uniref:uncharacterized protein n=1 Tax=Fusarium solani TaxID=169388 RepID=UPI0032C49539|nr:hypothetical protein MRS44_012213 [Fusarium solani]